MTNEEYNKTASDIGDSIKKTLRFLVVATIVLFVGLVGGLVYTYVVSLQNHDALCAYRVDLESRIKTSQDFLVKHPTGFGGITVKDIQTSINGQQHAVKAFQKIHC